VSSSVGSQSRETSLGIFETPGNKGYEISSGHFPFPSIHPEADKVYDGASAPRGPYAPPAITSPADEASDPYSVGVPPTAPAVVPMYCPKSHQTKEGKLQIDYTMISASFRDANGLFSGYFPPTKTAANPVVAYSPGAALPIIGGRRSTYNEYHKITSRSRSQPDCPTAYNSHRCPILEACERQWQPPTLMAGGRHAPRGESQDVC